MSKLETNDLPKRAEAFLARPIPAELLPHYVKGSLADIVLASCASKEPIDPELLEIAEMTVSEYDSAIEQARTDELRSYYIDCQLLVRAIIDAQGR